MTEFEKWKQESKLYKILSRDIQLYGSANCNEGDLQAIFEAGQKHPEWILVTERLPTEIDGKTEIISEHDFGWGDIDEDFIGDTVIQCLTTDGKVAHENMYDITKKIFTSDRVVIAWQPLPEE